MENMMNVNEVVENNEVEVNKIEEGAVMENTVVQDVQEVKVEKKSYRQDFLKVCHTIIGHKDNLDFISEDDMDKFITYFNEQINKAKSTTSTGEYTPTEKGHIILEVLISDEDKFFTAKEVATGSQEQLKSNGVSGAIRGLVTNEFVEARDGGKVKEYRITQKGIDYLG